MKYALAVLALLPLACASSAEAAPDTAPKPRPDAPAPAAGGGAACKPTGKVMFAIDHRVIDGTKLATYSIKVYGNGAWTRQDVDAEGKAAAPSAGCLDKAYAGELAKSLRGAPWKVTTAQVHCMAMTPQFIEYQVDGKRVFTQKLCSGQTLDDKSRAALDDAVSHVEQAAQPAP